MLHTFYKFVVGYTGGMNENYFKYTNIINKMKYNNKLKPNKLKQIIIANQMF